MPKSPNCPSSAEEQRKASDGKNQVPVKKTHFQPHGWTDGKTGVGKGYAHWVTFRRLNLRKVMAAHNAVQVDNPSNNKEQKAHKQQHTGPGRVLTNHSLPSSNCCPLEQTTRETQRLDISVLASAEC